MTFVKINGVQYPATVFGRVNDEKWDGRASMAITLEMTHEEAMETFCDGAEWSILQTVTTYDENGAVETVKEFDKSEYNIAGDVTDHRDGTVTAKMGKLTPLEEAYEIMLGGI